MLPRQRGFSAILILTLAAGLFAVAGTWQGVQAQQQPITSFERTRTENMLEQVHGELKKNYYDPTFHGIDVDARYKTYLERIKKAPTIGDAYRVVAAYLSGLDDSHTSFWPPRRSYRATYGYRMQMIGDKCFITDLRPDTDAAKKLHPGDEIVSLNQFTVTRKDLWQLDYSLNQIAPVPATEFVLRDPSGNERHETVMTKFETDKRVKDLSFENGDSDFWQLVLEDEKSEHLLRNRYAEQNDVLIWKMPVFTSDADALNDMLGKARKHKTLVLDLRGNPGGDEASVTLMVAGLFDHDVTICKRVMRKGEKPLVAKSRGRDAFTGQLIVLVDSESASAAEILARVVQLEHRGTVVGDLSSGSVMESRYYPFTIGADVVIFYGASITSADLIMADGKSLEKIGVTPDVLILPTAADLAAGRDAALARAAELAGIKLDPLAAGKMFPFEWAPK